MTQIQRLALTALLAVAVVLAGCSPDSRGPGTPAPMGESTPDEFPRPTQIVNPAQP